MSEQYGITDITKDFIIGNLLYAEQQTIKTRVETCMKCDKLLPTTFDIVGKCGTCGCLLAQKTKFSKSSCPENKW